ncbi:MAG: sensor domain-containing protein [Mycobacteriales bacterium]
MPSPTDLLRAPGSAAAWTATVHVVLGLPWALLSAPVLLVLLALTVGLLPLALLGLLPLWCALRVAWLVAAGDVLRARLVLREVIEPAPRQPRGRLLPDLRSAAAWRALCYALLLLPTNVLSAAVVVGAWSVGLTLTALPAYAALLPPDDTLRLGGAPSVALATLVGIAILLAAPWLARGTACLQVALLRALTGRPDRQQLTARVEDLEVSRAGVLDAADAERRRIERDLHDGAQPRLVRVALDLGMARAKLDDDPAAVRALLDSAHEEAKHALADLRDLVRGIHPSVLTDRGLGAALPPLAARLPVDVDLRVEVPARPPRAVEAAAYFVVSEALTNAVKHGGGSAVRVDVQRDGPSLRVLVADDGPGGAVLHPDGGLAGLQRRVAAVDGVLRVDSPPGSGTRIEAVLPCGS